MHNLAFIKGVMEKLAKMSIPGLNTSLQEHQEKAVEKFLNSPSGLILAHSLGSGKTLTAIAAALADNKPTDVIVPAALQNNFQKELDKHSSKSKIPFNIYSLQDIAIHPEKIPEDTLNRNLIIDEAHRLRNEKSKAYDILDNLKYNKKILLTGTPIYNSPVDVANLINMLDMEPKKLRLQVPKIEKLFGMSYEDAKNYALEFKNNKKIKDKREEILNSINEKNKPIIQNFLNSIGIKSSPYTKENVKELENEFINNSNDNELKKQWKKQKSYKQKIDLIASKLVKKETENNFQEEYKYNLDKFKDKLNKYVDLYTNKNTEDFPNKEIEIVKIPMYEEQAEEYTKYFKKIPKEIIEAFDNKRSQYGLISKAVRNPFLIKTRMLSNIYNGKSSKIDTMVNDIKNTKGKVLTYSNFIENGIIPFAKELDKLKIPYATFTGKESKEKRKEIVDKYNNDKIKVLLLSSAGGEGLDLKGTNLVQIMEPHWNEEKINQVVGRAARYKSHSHLPKNQRNVKIKYYMSIDKNDPEKNTTETYLQNMSTAKKRRAEFIYDMYDEKE